jgi:hypothetical protein
MGLFFDATGKQLWEDDDMLEKKKRGEFVSVDDFVQACADEDIDEARRAIETSQGWKHGNDTLEFSPIVDAFMTF